MFAYRNTYSRKFHTPRHAIFSFPDAVTRSAIFFAAATLLLCSGYCCSIIGQCARHKGLYTFISGIVFIVTGMFHSLYFIRFPLPLTGFQFFIYFNVRNCYSLYKHVFRFGVVFTYYLPMVFLFR